MDAEARVPQSLRRVPEAFSKDGVLVVVDMPAGQETSKRVMNGSPTFLAVVGDDKHRKRKWTMVPGVVSGNAGDAVIHLPLEHEHMYLTNYHGADNVLRGGGDVAVFGICDAGTISTLQRRMKPTYAGGAVYEKRVTLDYLGMKPQEFYGTFFRGAQQIARHIGKRPVITHCVAGMNRSSTSQLMFCLLRAWNPEYGRDDGRPHHFGKADAFNMPALIKYHKEANLIGRYPVLTNTTFVECLIKAAEFERLIHQPMFEGWLQLRQSGHIKETAMAFGVFVDQGKLAPLSREESGVSPSVSVSSTGDPPQQQLRTKKPKHTSLQALFPTLSATFADGASVGALEEPFRVPYKSMTSDGSAVAPVNLFASLGSFDD